jgi:curved DNA-binding protein CbpA
VTGTDFVDYYELLQLSSNADTDTVERVFRHLIKKFHPDNANSGDNDRFLLILEAHRTLTDPKARAGYDVQYTNYWNHKWRLASEAGDGTAFSDDRKIRERLLSLMYVQRRRSMRKPGLGEAEMAGLLHIPYELVEFHVWYLRAKGWVERLDSGKLAISAQGVDEVEQGRFRLGSDRLLTAGIAAPAGAEEQAKRSGEADLLVFPRDAELKR